MGKVNLDKKYSIILKAKKNRKCRSRDPISNALDKSLDASDLIENIHKKIKNRKLIQEARRQFVITSVTSIEVLLKDYFLKLLSLDNITENFSEHLNKKEFSIEDMEFIKDNEISKPELISDYYSFQDISDINKAFSTALSNNFFEDLKKYEWWFDRKDKNGFIVLGDFYEKLEKVINLRHDFVHDINFKFKLSKKEVDEIDSFCINFVSQLGFYMEEKICQLKSKN